MSAMRKKKPVEAGDCSYGGMVLSSFDSMIEEGSKVAQTNEVVRFRYGSGSNAECVLAIEYDELLDLALGLHASLTWHVQQHGASGMDRHRLDRFLEVVNRTPRSAA